MGSLEPVRIGRVGAPPSPPQTHQTSTSMSSLTFLARTFTAALAATALLGTQASAQTPLDPGDVAIIGWRDQGAAPSAFTIVFLADAPAGSQVYCTNNG